MQLKLEFFVLLKLQSNKKHFISFKMKFIKHWLSLQMNDSELNLTAFKIQNRIQMEMNKFVARRDFDVSDEFSG